MADIGGVFVVGTVEFAEVAGEQSFGCKSVDAGVVGLKAVVKDCLMEKKIFGENTGCLNSFDRRNHSY